MKIFKNTQNQLLPISMVDFVNERELQTMTEKNLKTVFNLEFVKSEFALNSLRIDTLAFDSNTNAFVIIEYKNDKNFSVIDQGYAYLSLLLNNKADFILEYNERGSSNLKKADIDWSQSKVMFICPDFTKYQRQAISFKDLPIELWESHKYSNDTVAYIQLISPDSSESINQVSKSSLVKEVSKEIKVYSEEEHLEGKSEEIKSLYAQLRDKVTSIDSSVQVFAKKYYIAFVRNSNFVDALPQGKNIKIWLNLPKGKLNDPKKITRDVSSIGHYGNGDYELTISSSEDLNNAFDLIVSAYNYKR